LKQRCGCRDIELFLLRLCGVHFLFLVFHLPECGARFELEVEFLLLHAAVPCYGGRFDNWRMDQRFGHTKYGTSRWPLWSRLLEHVSLHNFCRRWRLCSGCEVSKHNPCWRCRGVVPFPEFVLVSNIADWRQLCRVGIRSNEHGRTNRRHGDCLADSMD